MARVPKKRKQAKPPASPLAALLKNKHLEGGCGCETTPSTRSKTVRCISDTSWTGAICAALPSRRTSPGRSSNGTSGISSTTGRRTDIHSRSARNIPPGPCAWFRWLAQHNTSFTIRQLNWKCPGSMRVAETRADGCGKPNRSSSRRTSRYARATGPGAPRNAVFDRDAANRIRDLKMYDLDQIAAP